MASPSIFHLSLPVTDLEATRGFYCGLLGALPGRRTDAWMDLLVFGHQLTFHQQPAQVQPVEDQGVRHFGAILDWAQWQQLGEGLLASGHALELPPTIFAAGTPAEHGKVLLRDPSGHLVELKAYRDPATVSAPASMDQRIGLVSLVVPDYDEALAFYVGVLGFRLLEDSVQPAQGKRWVVVAPPGSATRPAVASSCSCIPTISTGTTGATASTASNSSARRCSSPTARSRSSATRGETCGTFCSRPEPAQSRGPATGSRQPRRTAIRRSPVHTSAPAAATSVGGQPIQPPSTTTPAPARAATA